jgi:hypothetical protein
MKNRAYAYGFQSRNTEKLSPADDCRETRRTARQVAGTNKEIHTAAVARVTLAFCEGWSGKVVFVRPSDFQMPTRSSVNPTIALNGARTGEILTTSVSVLEAKTLSTPIVRIMYAVTRRLRLLIDKTPSNEAKQA